MIVPVLLACALPATITLRHDDGASAGPNDYTELGLPARAAKELVRFEAPRRMRVTAVQYMAQGEPGRLELHFWKDLDSSVSPLIPFKNFEFPVSAPARADVTRATLGKWHTLALGESAFTLERGQRMFVGHYVEPGPQLACDRRLDARHGSTVELFNSQAPPREQVRLLSPAGDFLVRLQGAPIKEDRSIRFQEVFRAAGECSSILWGDVDGDGYEDLIVNGSRLYRNRGGEFSGPTTLPGVAHFGLLADLDGDGDLDLFRGTSDRTTSDSIWLNDGRGRFTHSRRLPSERRYGRAALALDYDRDGRLDLFVANGARFGDLVNADAAQLYQNRGAAFQSVYQDQLAGGSTPPFASAAAAGDLDRDGRTELFVGTYRLEPDQLWRFGPAGAQDLAKKWGIDGGRTPSGAWSGGHCLGAQMADVDDDGDLDLIVMNLMHPDWRGYLGTTESRLFENLGGGRFRNRALRERGIDFEETPAGPVLADFDNDGLLDLFHHSMYHSANLYRWVGGRWQERTASAGIRVRRATAAAACDFDRDGRVDLAVADEKGGLVLYRNISPMRSWIGFRLAARHCNRGGVGATVRIRLQGRTLTRLLAAGSGLASQDSPTLHFGLGVGAAPVMAEVTWPCGSKNVHRNLARNKVHRLIESPAPKR